MSNSRSWFQLVFCIVAACSTLGCPLESVEIDSLCAGHCGEILHAAGCACDEACESWEDCCPGYELICEPDRPAAGGASPTCEPAAGGNSTCQLPDRDPDGVIKIPTDTLQSGSLK